MRKTALFTAVLGLTAAACVETETYTELGTEAQEVVIVPAGTTCAALGFGGQEFKILNPESGQYAIDANNSLTFQYYDDTGTIFFYTNSTIRMGGVLVTTGDRTAAWEIGGATGWPSLGLYIDGVPQQPDSVSFCFDYELFLNPNGYANYGRSQGWSIAKSSTSVNLLLSQGQSYIAPYTVTVTPASTEPLKLFVEGPVFIANKSPQTVAIDAVTVLVGDLAATVTCPVALPYLLPPFTTLTCEFTVDVPDTSDRLVYVDVVHNSTLKVTRSLETASFASHTTSTVVFDRCVKVYDDHVAGTFLGTVCAADGARTFTYNAEIGPFPVCGPFAVENTAWFEGIDSGDGDSATFTIDGEVPCSLGCSLTPGYWKTHSSYGPAPYDDTWELLAGGAGAETPFFLSGSTYYRVLWTPTAGNVYYTLARAYIAAQLNQLNGADFTAASSAFAQATAIFQSYGPNDIVFAKKSTVRTQALALATTLDNYNNGRIGPGHCDE